MQAIRRRIPIFIALLCIFTLSSCIGIAASTGLGVYSIYKTKEERKREKYLYKCPPTHKHIDAYAAGIKAEHDAVLATSTGADKKVTTHMIDALEYYYIARNRRDNRAATRIIYLENIMPQKEKHEAQDRLERHAPKNLESCYLRF